MTDDLISWLTAQIDEDERLSKAATSGPWWHNPLKQWLGPEAFEKYDLTKGEEFVGYGGPHPFTGAIAATGRASDAEAMANAAHIANQDPPRALREVEAKHAILEAHQRITTQSDENSEELHRRMLHGARWTDPEWSRKQTQLRTDGWQLEGYRRASTHALRCLALAYEDRPGYRDEWRLT